MHAKSSIAVLLLAGLSLLGGCGQQGKAPKPEVDAQLFKLAQMNGCIECHTVSTGNVGPSWMAIAERYKAAPREAARALLVQRVMKGSKGKWLTWKDGGQGMPPLGRRVAKDDVVQLVDYILSVNRCRGRAHRPSSTRRRDRFEQTLFRGLRTQSRPHTRGDPPVAVGVLFGPRDRQRHRTARRVFRAADAASRLAAHRSCGTSRWHSPLARGGESFQPACAARVGRGRGDVARAGGGCGVLRQYHSHYALAGGAGDVRGRGGLAAGAGSVSAVWPFQLRRRDDRSPRNRGDRFWDRAA